MTQVTKRPVPGPSMRPRPATDQGPKSAVGAPEIIDGGRTPFHVPAVLLAVIAAMGLALWGFTDTLVGADKIELPRLAVPSVDGLTLEQGRLRLEEAGFTVDVRFQPNEDNPKGEVIGQRPLAGYKADQGDVVTILASDGPMGWTVPAMVGQQMADALVSLSAANVQIEPVDQFSETIRAGEVMASIPAEGSRVQPGTALRVVVSAGPAPRRVPEVLNLPLEQALVQLGRAGLMVGEITKAHRPELAPNSVVELSAPPGTELARDTPVSITVAVPQDLRKVPYLTGLLVGSAEEMLRSVGLSPQVVQVAVPAGSASIGRVTSQGTAPQTELAKGTSVAISVGVAEAVAPAPPGTAGP